MKLVSVNAPSASYTVKIGPGLLDHLGEEVRACTRAGRAVVVSGEHVFPLYGERAVKSLQKNGIKAESVVFPSGEETKSLACYGELLNAYGYSVPAGEKSCEVLNYYTGEKKS